MRNKTKKIAMSALFAALIAAATLLHLPIFSQGGYAHLGDGVIYLAASVLPLPYAAAAAALGGALGDLLFGYFSWIPFTAVIKALNVLPFFMFSKKTAEKKKIITKRSVIACVISGVITCAGYFLSSWVLYGTAAAAIADIPGNVLQAVLSAVVYIIVGSALSAAKINFKG